jgi:DNA-directed RNA polymerase subunit RPC12/RpoP
MAGFYCKHCGQSMPSVQALVSNSCLKSPGKRHVLYEGGEKASYTCKHCGRSMASIRALVTNACLKSPTKFHEPAL